MNETRTLAEWVAATELENLPLEVVSAVKVYLLDDLAAGFAGSLTPWAEMVAGMAREMSSGPCSLFGRPYGLSPSYAALTNGVMVGGFEVDHPYTQGSCHPSAAVFPALLAIAEREHLDGPRFLTAMALGYEVLCRVGAAATRAVEDERGFHGPGTNAAFGAAAAVAKALGLSGSGIANALGVAGSHGGGLLEFFREGAMTKRIHIGRGAQMGLESALLAARGFTGPTTVLEGDHGFLHVYSPSPKVDELTKELGSRYLTTGVTLKAYPCHISFHAVIEGIQRQRSSRGFSATDVQAVSIAGSHRMMEERFANRRPGTIMGAQYSLAWAAALALTRDVSSPATWLALDFEDRDVARIAGMIQLRDDPRFGARGGPVAEVSLMLSGEQVAFEVTDWKGAPSNPYSFDEIGEKFRRYASPVISEGRVSDIIERVTGIEEEEDMAALAGAIRGRGRGVPSPLAGEG